MPRRLVLFGSGETAPRAAAVHRRALAGIDGSGVLLDTPFGFQENAGELTERALAYFADRFGLALSVATFRDADTASPRERETFELAVETAAFVFAGPGSPTYAARQWRSTRLASLLRDKLRDGGVISFASAAAITLGRFAVPVYEVYKVGAAPHWSEGLDVLAELGIDCAVLPHFDNAEGGGHDTRFCFMGQRRLDLLRAQLPATTRVLGIDEQTAIVIDCALDSATVMGLGGVTVLSGAETVTYRSGETFALETLRRDGAHVATPATLPSAAPDSVAAVVASLDSAFDEHDADEVVARLLDLDTRAHAGDADAGTALRRRLVRIPELVGADTAAVRELLTPLVEGLLGLRRSAREERRFDDADTIRAVIEGCGIEVRDTPDGAAWELATPKTR